MSFGLRCHRQSKDSNLLLETRVAVLESRRYTYETACEGFRSAAAGPWI